MGRLEIKRFSLPPPSWRRTCKNLLSKEERGNKVRFCEPCNLCEAFYPYPIRKVFLDSIYIGTTGKKVTKVTKVHTTPTPNTFCRPIQCTMTPTARFIECIEAEGVGMVHTARKKKCPQTPLPLVMSSRHRVMSSCLVQ